MSIKPPNWPVEYGHYPFDEVTSTLDVAHVQAGQYPNPTWFTATRQTTARGRRGRAWVEPEGNFAATLSLAVDAPTAPLRSFVAALALADAMSAFLGSDDALSLKWPNDVLLSGGKVAGILLESLSHQNRIWGVAIGIGVNLAAAPPPSELEPDAVPPVALADVAGRTVSPKDFLAHLAPAFDHWETRFRQMGFAPIRQAWLNRAARLGETITARTAREEHVGTFETIDNVGQLVLRTSKGQVQIPAADVFF